MKILLTLFIATVLINVACAQDVPIAAYNQDLLQKDTRFIYPGYTIKIHHFNVFNEKEGDNGTNYNGDISQVTLSNTGEITTIRIKKDSVIINDDPNSDLESSIIEIIPKNRTDTFKLYYSCPVQLQEIVAEKSYDIDNPVPVSSFSLKSLRWKGTTKYKPLISKDKYTYQIPKIDISSYEEPDGWMYEEIKGKLHLKGKIIQDKIAHTRMNILVYKNKQCLLNPQGICFRVERYMNGTHKSTKYLLIEFEDYD